MVRALLTGASSYLGNELANRLSKSGVDVYLVIRATTRRDRLPACIPPQRRLVHDGSTRGMIEIVAASAPDIVYHIAGSYFPAPEPVDVDAMITANVTLGVQLVEALLRSEQKACIVNAASGLQFYGGDSNLQPLNLYAATKQALQDILDYYGSAADVMHVNMVLFETYGPNDWRTKFISAATDAALRGTVLSLPDQDLAMDVVHIEDAAEAFVVAGSRLLADPASIRGRHFAVSSGRHWRLSELTALIERAAGTPIRTDWGGYKLPPRRIEVPWSGPTLPDWQPRIPLEEGVSAFVAHRRRAVPHER